ncbi:MAG TPA: hypothetical protein VF480_02690 [Verrucomicrobiae bacterium]
MESTLNVLAKNGQAIADRAADKVQSGIDEAGPLLTKMAGQVQSIGKNGMDTVADMTSQALDLASNASDSIIAYTKKNPVTALAIAAASAVLIYAAIRAFSPSRD